ncbi:MAG: hypothetical protein MUF49_30325 [Oculatellaceae cyanobacterium Prado106]|jgi:hypothetical protein|nr:hypothetical protein [Oculatellaceae cyanobacterium Prado106]
MEPDQDAQLSQLLDRQQAGFLSADKQLDLQALMQIYQEGLLQKQLPSTRPFSGV